MSNYRIVSVCAMAVAVFALFSTAAAQSIAKGVVVPKLTTVDDPQQSYAIYLPSYYSPGHKWPVIYAFDPGARGNVPVELFKDAAEKFGYIIAGSNNSRKGPFAEGAAAGQAMWKDTHQRFSVDDARIYMAGFSGGARLATSLALQCKCVLGVFASGAGFPAGVAPSRENQFWYFGTIGETDFNYPEMVKLEQQLDDAGFVSRIAHFDGSHQWAPEAVAMEGIEWFELQTMKNGIEPSRPQFVAEQLEKAKTEAKRLEDSGDIIRAREAYSKLAQDFQTPEIQGYAEKAEELSKTKAYQEGRKREQDEIKHQARLTEDILRSFMSVRSNSDDRQIAISQLRAQLTTLKNAAKKEGSRSESKITSRALGQVTVHIAETGQEDIRKREFSLAVLGFDLLTELQPDSPSPYLQKARAYALSGDKKKSISNLRQAVGRGFTNVTQLLENQDFASLRSEEEFKKLVSEISGAPPVKK